MNVRVFTTFIYQQDSSLHRFNLLFPTMHSVFFSLGVEHGLVIFIFDPGLLRPERAVDIRHRKIGEAVMTFYIIGAIAALFLMVYLFIALLKPELFS